MTHATEGGEMGPYTYDPATRKVTHRDHPGPLTEARVREIVLQVLAAWVKQGTFSEDVAKNLGQHDERIRGIVREELLSHGLIKVWKTRTVSIDEMKAMYPDSEADKWRKIADDLATETKRLHESWFMDPGIKKALAAYDEAAREEGPKP